MQMKKIIMFMSLLLMSANAMADINKVLNYQGYLTDANNQPVADGQYVVQFRLYAQESGGTANWGETQTLTVAKGYFNTTLGNSTSLDLSLFDNELWLGIQVGADPEMSPRRK
jgi:type 1 fimbria pilin